jgi:2-oxoacid:acceptor oxidoreductase gamma subunit (pyruvate/2-ketoisovalerate family)
MVEIRIHGRGGQGGVTLAKLIATARFLHGDSVQAFGLYAAERSGAPVQAFCRYDRGEVTNRNLIYEPDHVIVLDPTLIGPSIVEGLKPEGWVLLNTPESPEAFRDHFPGNRIGTVDATAIAREHGLGTRSVPIVNTALLGAALRLLDYPVEDAEAALDHLGFGGGNVGATRDAYGAVVGDGSARAVPEGPVEKPTAKAVPVGIDGARGPSFVAGDGGDLPGIRTGSWANEQPHRQQAVPPCNHVCPAGNDVQGFLHALAEDRTDDALAILLDTSPFPSVCGRVCPAPCMASCNRIPLDGAVNVRQLERYAGDHGVARVEKLDERAEQVAVVGSGPGGLTAAYHLARFGYTVTVFEAAPEVGGLLRSGIPDFRLPEDVLDRELDRIEGLGVTFVTDRAVDRFTLMRLAEDYDAVLVATGLQELRGLRLGVGNADGVEQGIVFLERARVGEVQLDGEEIMVVGGGNTAMDAARTALRLGARHVRVVYRRTREEMPAIREEIDEALEEGVEIDFLTQPVSVQPRVPDPSGGGNGDGTPARGPFVVTCRRMELGEPDGSGRRRPVEIPGSDHALSCDRIILALGQSPDLSVFPEGTEVREGDRLLGVLEKPVYALGDLATNHGTVSGAIGSGRRAAFHVHNTLADAGLPQEEVHHGRRPDVEVWKDEVVRPEAMRFHLFERSAPAEGATISLDRRLSTFEEIHDGLADPSEARRCLSCGVCNDCDLCITYCPEGVLKRVGGRLVFDYAYCKGCGVCVTECPRNVIFMSHL